MSSSNSKVNKTRRQWALTKGRCVYCNVIVPEELRSLDHIWPQSKGGANWEANLMAACKTCNERRNTYYPPSDLVDPTWRKFVRDREAELYRISPFVKCMVDGMREKNMPSIGKVKKVQKRKRHR